MYGHGSRRSRKPRVTVLVKASSKLVPCIALSCPVLLCAVTAILPYSLHGRMPRWFLHIVIKLGQRSFPEYAKET
jgi:hypothetical protein